MKKITLIILFVMSGGFAFAKHRHKKKHPDSYRDAGNIISVSMHRTACYGQCPDYTVEIDNDGSVTYTAVRFNPDTGIFKKNIGVEKAMEIINQFNIYRVDTCKDLYKTRIPDIPSLIIIIKYNDSTKTIREANSGPLFLKQLANTIDKAGRKTDSTWHKTDQ